MVNSPDGEFPHSRIQEKGTNAERCLEEVLFKRDFVNIRHKNKLFLADQMPGKKANPGRIYFIVAHEVPEEYSNTIYKKRYREESSDRQFIEKIEPRDMQEREEY